MQLVWKDFSQVFQFAWILLYSWISLRLLLVSLENEDFLKQDHINNVVHSWASVSQPCKDQSPKSKGPLESQSLCNWALNLFLAKLYPIWWPWGLSDRLWTWILVRINHANISQVTLRYPPPNHPATKRRSVGK